MGQILIIKIEKVTNIMTQLYNYSDIYNKVLEIKKNTLTRVSSADTFISKETKNTITVWEEKFLKEKREQKSLGIKCQAFKVNLTKSNTSVPLAAMMTVT